MENTDALKMVRERAENWLSGNYDENTRQKVRYLLENNEKELVDAFYRNLEFGTGGLRGIMGVGTNRMNIYTVGMATQGLANYLKLQFKDNGQIKVAIAYDSRNNSKLFAETTANVFTANGIKVYIFDSLRPTPELSFTIRHFGCQSGIVITASHNPKEYNGYKAYWEDGGQVVSPHDKNIIAEVEKIKSPDEVLFNGNKDLLEVIGSVIDEIYTDRIKEISLSPEVIKRNEDIRIVYTPIHGTGVKLVPLALKKLGFQNIFHVPEQDISDGNFPTVHSPNPEEPAALELAVQKAREVNADLLMGTDPDADRVGIAIKNDQGEYILLNGNQTGALLINYLLTKWNELGKLTGNEYVVKTIVTSELIAEIAKKHKVEYFDVLTGFKFIANTIKQHEGKRTFIGGGEESYGYLAGEFVRDKDAVIACSLIAEIAAWAKDQGKTLYDMLMELYVEYGLYKEKLISVVRKGKEGAEEIEKMMERFRNYPPSNINGSEVMLIKDYLQQKVFGKIAGDEDINLPKSNVLQFFLKDGSIISVRPSGTEPKIKFYFSVKEKLHNKAEYDKTNTVLNLRIESIIEDLKLN
jgi:phosphoglucomutase